MNIVTGTVDEQGANYGTLSIPLTPEQRSAFTGDTVTIGIRPTTSTSP